MRDRLIELLKFPFNCMPHSKCESCGLNGGCSVQRQADKILEDGWIRLPCKVGDTVWYISEENPFVAFENELKARPDPTPIKGILITEEGLYTCTSEIDRVKDFCDKVGEQYSYLSEEDANKEIEQRKEDEGK